METFWTGKRVLVTGHTGFKGSWLCLWLQRLGALVTGYSLPAPTQPNLFELACVSMGMKESILADIRNYERLRAAFRDHNPAVVFHLAAQPLARISYLEPRETYEVNLMGTVNLLESVRNSPGTKAVLVVTSDKCYENNEWPWSYRENDRLGGRDPYSSSKACAELATAAFRDSYYPTHAYHSHGLGIASARAGNVIGGGDWAADRLVPDLFRALERDMQILIRNPNAVRPWQHVLEPLSGYLTLAQRLHDNGSSYSAAWNFGPSGQEGWGVGDIADRFVRKFKHCPGWRFDDRAHPHEATYLKLDSSRSRTELQWQPRLELDEALDWTFDWYSDCARGCDMHEKTVGQISAYAARMTMPAVAS